MIRGDSTNRAQLEGDSPLIREGESDDSPQELDHNARDREWVLLAEQSYRASTDYFDTNVRRRIQRDLSNFNSQHPPGSRFLLPAYQKKSKLFRPKTRAAVNKLQAAVAQALFATQESAHCQADDESDEMQAAGADAMNYILNKRLEDKDFAWYLTALGGAQDAMTAGVVISFTDWLYKEGYEVTDPDDRSEDEDGRTQWQEAKVVKEDRPRVTIRPVEQFRWDPAADWRDPVGTSPYLIDMEAVYVFEIMEGQKTENPMTGRPIYRENINPLAFKAASDEAWDALRNIREEGTTDKYNDSHRVDEYATVWVYKNIVHHEGRDWYYETLGCHYLLTDPVPLEVQLPLGRDHYQVGVSTVESHKVYPNSPAGLGAPLQEEVNEHTNLRMDNLRLAMNKRWLYRKGIPLDVGALMRSVAGSALGVTDVNNDVKALDYPDVTRGAYEEGDRLATEHDEMMGNASQSTIANRRSMNDRVGALSLIMGDANEIREMTVFTIVETWVSKVMSTLKELIALYETDERLLAVASAKTKLPVEQVVAALEQTFTTRVNAGLNATNPAIRLQRLSVAFQTVFAIKPDLQRQVDPAPLVQEIFGSGAGVRDAERFFIGLDEEADPQVTMLMQQVQELEAAVEAQVAKEQAKGEIQLQAAEINARARVAVAEINGQVQMAREQAAGDRQMTLAQMKNMLDEYDRVLATRKSDDDRMSIWMQREALSHAIQKENREFLVQQQQQRAMRENEIQSAGGDGAPNLPGDDKAGVISRGNYGMFPGKEG